jgi:16S rRNA (guanine527-N7)-methyltransferase
MMLLLYISYVLLSTSALVNSVVVNTADWKHYVPQFPNLDTTQWGKLEELSERLKDWNSKVNLISRKDIDSLIPNHIMPCVALSKVKQFNGNERVIDVGTGGGLPGLPMAICNPNAQFTLLDSNLKKTTIVEDIAKGLKLENVRVVRNRAEEFREVFDFMLGRF